MTLAHFAEFGKQRYMYATIQVLMILMGNCYKVWKDWLCNYTFIENNSIYGDWLLDLLVIPWFMVLGTLRWNKAVFACLYAPPCLPEESQEYLLSSIQGDCQANGCAVLNAWPSTSVSLTIFNPWLVKSQMGNPHMYRESLNWYLCIDKQTRNSLRVVWYSVHLYVTGLALHLV